MTAPQTQFIRRCGLVVYNPPTYSQAATASPATGSTLTSAPGSGTATPGSGLDLSSMRIQFRVSANDNQTPNNAIIRVYNLKDTTVRAVRGEFQRVTLQAGYEGGAYGVIFDGTIKQVMTGHESSVDSYVDIYAADGDIAYTQSVVNTTLAAGSTTADHVAAIASATGLPQGYVVDLPPSALARGKVMFGMARDHMRQIAGTNGCRWSIQHGQLVLVPLTGYQPGEAVVLTSATGLIGFPQQTPGGIMATALLNPKIQVSGLVQIDNKAINQSLSPAPLYSKGRLEGIPGYTAKISDDGYYKVLVHEFEGDTRGQPWYSHMTCLAVDMSAPVGQQVKPYWAGGPG